LPNQSNINILTSSGEEIWRKSSATVVGGAVLEARTVLFSTKVSIITSHQSKRAQRNNQEVISGGNRV